MFNIFKAKKVVSKKRIYLDHASAVPVLDYVLDEYVRVSKEIFANPSSIHAEGEKSREILESLRAGVAKCIRARKSEVQFVSSSTEANNIFIKGCIQSLNEKSHIITSLAEHASLLESVKHLESQGVSVNYITPNAKGVLEVEEIKKALRPETVLVCLSSVNSEAGSVQNVREIALMLENYAKANNTLKPKLYIDATQAVEYDTVDVGTLLCDGMTFGARKIGAVPGVALLFVKHGVKLEKLIHGGGQEGGIKSGTENIALIAAFYKVLQNAVDKKSKTESVRRLNQIRSYTIERLQNELGDRVEVLGDTKVKYESENKQTFPYFKHASPHILLIYVKGLLGEEMLLRLDARGIAVSTASACSILEGSGSNFLKSLGREKDAKETIRISFGKETAKADIDYFVMALKGIMDKYQK